MTKIKSVSTIKRQKIENMLAKYDIKKKEIAIVSSLSDRTVIRFFQNQSDNTEVYQTAKRVIIAKIKKINLQSTSANEDLMELAADQLL